LAIEKAEWISPAVIGFSANSSTMRLRVGSASAASTTLGVSFAVAIFIIDANHITHDRSVGVPTARTNMDCVSI
jgi:hypothetical protein